MVREPKRADLDAREEAVQHYASTIHAPRDNVIGVDEEDEARTHDDYPNDDVNPCEPPLKVRGWCIPLRLLWKCRIGNSGHKFSFSLLRGVISGCKVTKP